VPIYWLPALFIVIALATGSTMPVVQLTVQVVAGPKNLGAASASVQFMRSIGAALGTATIGAVLFAVLSAQDPQIAALFTEVVERGPQILQGKSPALVATLTADVIGAFRAAFLTISSFAIVAMLLAWSLPMRRL